MFYSVTFRLITILLLLILFPLHAISQQNITLTGKIFVDKKPVDSIYVKLYIDGKLADSALTNTTGRYEFRIGKGHEYILAAKTSETLEKQIGPIPVKEEQTLDYLAFNIDLEKTNSVYFSVQLFAGKKKVTVDLFKYPDVTERQEDGYYRYTSGTFLTEKEANARKQELHKAGQTQAFVTAYKNGKRVQIYEARQFVR